MLSAVHVMADYWSPGDNYRSPVGKLVAAAKDADDREAVLLLGAQLAAFAKSLDLPECCLVVAVPPGPQRPAHPVPSLAEAVGAALGGASVPLLERRNPTAQLRDTPPDGRHTVVDAAGYAVRGEVTGCAIVLVDDVILTGTTLRYLADLLVSAGAGRVEAVVAARTRVA